MPYPHTLDNRTVAFEIPAPANMARRPAASPRRARGPRSVLPFPATAIRRSPAREIVSRLADIVLDDGRTLA